jgi:hypothetical protein
MGVSGRRHALAALHPPGNTPGTDWIIGYEAVGVRAGLDTEDAFAGDRTTVVQSVVRHYTELPELQQISFVKLKEDSGIDGTIRLT